MWIWIRCYFLKCVFLLAACLWLPVAYPACGLSVQSHAISLSIDENDPAWVDSNQPYQLDSRRSNFTIATGRWRLNHQYQQLGYDRSNTDTPVTNGHLHRLALAYENTRYTDSNPVNWSIQPTLAVSSNQVRYSDHLNGSAFRLEGHVFWQLTMQEYVRYYLGACLSVLTGDYELIPVLALDYQDDNLHMVLGYPYSQLDLPMTGSTHLVAGWSLQGEQWQVLDQSLQNRSDLRYSMQRFRMGLTFNSDSHHLFEFYWQKSIHRSIAYLDRNGNQLAHEVANSEGWILRYVYLQSF